MCRSPRPTMVFCVSEGGGGRGQGVRGAREAGWGACWWWGAGVMQGVGGQGAYRWGTLGQHEGGGEHVHVHVWPGSECAAGAACGWGACMNGQAVSERQGRS